MTLLVDPKLATGQTSTVHVFERSGLGKAPFTFSGMTEKTYQSCHGAPIHPGSSCDYCQTCIRYEFWLHSFDGKIFKVGSDCVHKTGDRGLIRQISEAERKLRDVKNAAAKLRKNERKEKRIAAAIAILPTVRRTLASKPHPNSYFAAEGRTLLDYVGWCLDNRAGEMAARIIETESAQP